MDRKRRREESRLRSILGAETRTRTDGSGQFDSHERRLAITRGLDSLDPTWFVGNTVLVFASRRSTHHSLHGTDARRNVLDRERQEDEAGEESALQRFADLHVE